MSTPSEALQSLINIVGEEIVKNVTPRLRELAKNAVNEAIANNEIIHEKVISEVDLRVEAVVEKKLGSEIDDALDNFVEERRFESAVKSTVEQMDLDIDTHVKDALRDMVFGKELTATISLDEP